MNSFNTQLSVFPDSKSHYEILDGLRGVAAIMVVIFHVFETHTGGNHLIQIINHGYLAVDFFFVLSGFVIGYAYDDRWSKMSLRGFFKRRLIRLHPMIIMGSVIGAATFYLQDGGYFPGISEVPVWKMLLVMLLGFTLLPLPVSWDIRGWIEMHPLNGPAWSLFFEYIANILYALFVRKFSNTLLAVFVFIFGCALIHFAVNSPTGDVIGGWALNPEQMRIGFTRLLFPFFGGLLLSRIAKPTHLKHAFLWCSLLVIAVLAMPRVGGSEHLWMNGLYDSLTIIFVFPLIVYLGSSGEVKGKFASAVCKFLGDISYPIYITHYPLIYIYTGWVTEHNVPLSEAYPYGILLVVSSIAIAYGCLKFYDVPVRKWLTDRFMRKRA
ncbi:MAG TPA: acyltransferase [Bacteroidales bacterium]|nr:acyltransferase [Bacteroidales bacterium]